MTCLPEGVRWVSDVPAGLELVSHDLPHPVLVRHIRLLPVRPVDSQTYSDGKWWRCLTGDGLHIAYREEDLFHTPTGALFARLTDDVPALLSTLYTETCNG